MKAEPSGVVIFHLFFFLLDFLGGFLNFIFSKPLTKFFMIHIFNRVFLYTYIFLCSKLFLSCGGNDMSSL